MGYNPNQPRDPEGVPTGGQWTGEGSVAARAAREAAGLAPKGLRELKKFPQDNVNKAIVWEDKIYTSDEDVAYETHAQILARLAKSEWQEFNDYEKAWIQNVIDKNIQDDSDIEEIIMKTTGAFTIERTTLVTGMNVVAHSRNLVPRKGEVMGIVNKVQDLIIEERLQFRGAEKIWLHMGSSMLKGVVYDRFTNIEDVDSFNNGLIKPRFYGE